MVTVGVTSSALVGIKSSWRLVELRNTTLAGYFLPSCHFLHLKKYFSFLTRTIGGVVSQNSKHVNRYGVLKGFTCMKTRV
jgi:hypothetical protein